MQIFYRFLQESFDGEQADSGIEILPSYELNHINMMPYLWTVVIDVSIFFALYKFRTFHIYIHSIIALFVSLTTLITSLPILIEEGIPQEEDDSYEQRHFIIGLIVIIIIFVQVTLGITAKILQMIRWSHPYLVFLMNMTHKYLGYALVILCKIQVFLILSLDEENDKLFWGLIAAEAILLFLWILRKILYPRLQETIMPKYSVNSIPKIESLSAAKKQNQLIGVFANYVYNLQPLLMNHPQGFRIVDSIKGVEMDRFLYGMYPSQRFPLIPPNSHGYKTLSLLDNPIGKITIPNVYEGLEMEITDVELVNVSLVSSKGRIYQLKLQKKEGNFSFKGYESLNQIGRYYSLTLDNNVTRLYTTVGFLDQQNKSFIQKQLNLSLSTNTFSKKTPINEQIPLTLRQLQHKQQNRYISLLVKQYPNGALTPKLVRKTFKTLQLSQSRGEGLRFHQLTPGKVIMVAGGTGLYPFSDFIDLLFKDQIASKAPKKQNQIYKKNPILRLKPFQGFSFHLLLAVHHIEDIHPITLSQIVDLSKMSNNFKATFKVNDDSQQFRSFNKQITYTDEGFDKLCLKQMSVQPFEKVWICGPPKMNSAVIDELDKHKIDPSKYLML